MKKLLVPFCLTLIILLGSTGMSASADYQVGFTAYHKGDYATALRAWKPLAENKGILSFTYSKQDIINAQIFLGLMYEKGQGVSQNYKTAVKWYKLAAKQGFANAQNNLGVMYRDGQGVTQDDKTAVKWFRLAAEQGYADGQSSLGFMYDTGRGVIQDNVYAHMWYNIAASSGEKTARENKDIIVTKMTPAEISKAQDLARECVRKKYKGC